MSYYNSNMFPGAGCLIVTLVFALVGIGAACYGVWWLFQHMTFGWA